MPPAQHNVLTTAMPALDVFMTTVVALKVNPLTMLTVMLTVLLLSKQPKIKMAMSKIFLIKKIKEKGKQK